MADFLETTLATLASYQTIAEDPAKRVYLLKDAACLTALLYFIDDTNDSVAFGALQILCLLLEKQKHAEIMQKDERFVNVLEQAKLKASNSEHVSFLLDTCLKRLSPEENGQKLKEIKNDSANNSNIATTEFRAPAVPSKKRPVRFMGGGMKAQTLVFFLEGDMHHENVSLVEERLMHVKGVISIYLDKRTSKCTVRARLETKPEIVAASITDLGHFHVFHVTKNEYGEEVRISMNDADTDVDKENNDDDDFPAYLNESLGDSPKGHGLDRAVVAPGARRKKRRESNTWVSSVTSFLASSFYW